MFREQRKVQIDQTLDPDPLQETGGTKCLSPNLIGNLLPLWVGGVSYLDRGKVKMVVYQ